MQEWLNGAQLPVDLTFEKLAGRVKLDPWVVREFLESFTREITTHPTLREDLNLRRSGELVETSRKHLKLKEQELAGPARERQQAFAEYRMKVRETFSSIMLFGERSPGGEENVFERMSDIRRGFVPLNLKPWPNEEVHQQPSSLGIDDLFFNKRPRLMLIRGLPGGGKTTLLRYLAWRFTAADSTMLPVYIRLKFLDLSTESLLDFIHREVSALWTNPAIDDALRHKDCFLEKPMLMLLDGIDEIKSASSHAKFAEASNTLACREKNGAKLSLPRALLNSKRKITRNSKHLTSINSQSR